MASLGYNAEWNIISAASVGAPHRRDRIIIVAYPEIVGGYVRKNRNNTSSTNEGEKMGVEIGTIGSYVANANSTPRQQQYQGQISEPNIKRRGNWGGRWPTEPDVGRVANGVPSRVDRLKCLGNAVVPQVAELVGLLVIQHMERVAND
jgi:DNA (cytosine-5)-methyltransferase 1